MAISKTYWIHYSIHLRNQKIGWLSFTCNSNCQCFQQGLQKVKTNNHNDKKNKTLGDFTCNKIHYVT